MAKWIGRSTLDQRVVGSIPKPGTYVQFSKTFTPRCCSPPRCIAVGRCAWFICMMSICAPLNGSLAKMLHREWRECT